MAERKNHIMEVLKQAENGIRAVFESDRFKDYLQTMSKFHNYSIRNIMLIKSERPDATYVAGFRAWDKKFGRHVKKGEKGIPIIGYTPKTVHREEKRLTEKGKEETVLTKRIIPWYKVVYVYDISQTYGRPLPKLIENLQGRVGNYENLFESLKSVSPYNVDFEKMGDGKNGYCDFASKVIKIREGMSEKQNIKTVIHEIAHANMHNQKDKKIDRRTAEVEAEAVAYVVSEHFGLDTSSYSFGYIASWSSGKELKELEDSLSRIQHESSDLIGKIEEKYLELSPPETDINRFIKGDRVDSISVDEVLKPEVLKACVDLKIPVGYYAYQSAEGKQMNKEEELANIGSVDEYSIVFKDIKVGAQIKEGIGNEGFCYYESPLNTPTINPNFMTQEEVATTNFLLSEFMEQPNWPAIKDYMQYNAPVNYDKVIEIRDKFYHEDLIMEAVKKYPGKTETELRNLAGYVTVTDNAASFKFKGEEGLWNVAESQNIYGNKYFLMYNENNVNESIIVDKAGRIQMRDKGFEDLKDRLDEEAYFATAAQKDEAKKSGIAKRKRKERER